MTVFKSPFSTQVFSCHMAWTQIQEHGLLSHTLRPERWKTGEPEGGRVLLHSHCPNRLCLFTTDMPHTVGFSCECQFFSVKNKKRSGFYQLNHWDVKNKSMGEVILTNTKTNKWDFPEADWVETPTSYSKSKLISFSFYSVIINLSDL